MKIDVEGIVISQNPYKEKDAMVSILTKDGIVSFLARSVQSISSKNKSSCLPFSYSTFTLNTKLDKLSLVQGKVIKSYYHLYDSLERLSSINLINECIYKFVDEDNKTLFEYLKNYLELMDLGFDETTLTLILLAQIVKNSGYDLEFNSCVQCGSKKDIVGISYKDGGFICKKCLYSLDFKRSKEYLKTFRYVFMVPPNMMTHYVVDGEIGYKLIIEFCSHLASSFGYNEIKSLEIYNSTKK